MNNFYEDSKSKIQENSTPINALTEDNTEITNGNDSSPSTSNQNTELTSINNDNANNEHRKKSKNVTFGDVLINEISNEIEPGKDEEQKIESIDPVNVNNNKEILKDESSNQMDTSTALTDTTKIANDEIKNNDTFIKNDNNNEENTCEDCINNNEENTRENHTNNNEENTGENHISNNKENNESNDNNHTNDTEVVDTLTDKKNDDFDGNKEVVRNGKKKIILKLNNDNGSGNPSDVQNNLLELEVDQLNNIEQIRFIIKIASNSLDQYLKYGFVSKYNFTSKYHIIHVDQHVRLPSHFTEGKIRANEIKSSQNLINMQRKRHLYTMAILNNANIINIMDIDGFSNVNHTLTVKLKEKFNKYILLEKIGHYAACYNNTVIEVN